MYDVLDSTISGSKEPLQKLKVSVNSRISPKIRLAQDAQSLPQDFAHRPFPIRNCLIATHGLGGRFPITQYNMLLRMILLR